MQNGTQEFRFSTTIVAKNAINSETVRKIKLASSIFHLLRGGLEIKIYQW